jgi:hypothetical protein
MFGNLGDVRHEGCARKESLVRVWVILDRPPNDPLLRKKEPFTSSKPANESGPDVRSEAGSVLTTQKSKGRAVGDRYMPFFLNPIR